MVGIIIKFVMLPQAVIRDVVPMKAGNKFHYYWIPYRTSLASELLDLQGCGHGL